MRQPAKDVLLFSDASNTSLPLQLLGRRRVLLAGLGSLAAVCFGSRRSAAAQAADEWRSTVCRLIDSTCGANSFRLGYTARTAALLPYIGSDFHTKFAAPFAFVGVGVPAVPAGEGLYLRLGAFPYYDIDSNPRDFKDMNAWEIRRVTNEKEISDYGAVLAPCGHRTLPRPEVKDEFLKTAKRYDIDAQKTTLEFERPFNDGRGGKATGFGIILGKDAAGLPKKDVLLSSKYV